MNAGGSGTTDRQERTTADYTRVMVGLHDYMMLLLHHEADGMTPEEAADANSKAIATGQVGMSNPEADELIERRRQATRSILTADDAQRIEYLQSKCHIDTYLANVEASKVQALDAHLSSALDRPITTICLARPREAHRSTRRTASTAASKSKASDPPSRTPAPSHQGLERLGNILGRLFADLEEAQPQHAEHWRELRTRAGAR